MKTIKKIKLPIRIVLCGLGVWGRNWLENIKENKNYELVAVVENNIDTLNQFKASGLMDNSLCFSDITKAIEFTKPDAVAVIVSPDRHADIIRVALEKKVHVLSEKPLAKDIDEAKEFMALHRDSPEIRFIVNQNYRGRDCTSTMKRIIEDGAIGDVGYFVYSHQQTVKIPGYRLEMPSPVLDDMSIHHFDMMRYLTGQDFEEIYATENTVPWSWFQGKPMFNSLIKMTGGVSGIYSACWAAEGKIGSWNGNIQIFGSEGCVELADDVKVILYNKHQVGEDLLGTYHSGCKVKLSSVDSSELQYTLEKFQTALTQNKECETDIEENIKSLVAILAAKKSVKQNSPVSIASLGAFQ